jgi:hypothetical protein
LSRTRRARRGPWISEELHSLNYRRFFPNDGLPDFNVNVNTDQQPELRSLSEFYIIIFLNKLKIFENTNNTMKAYQ